MNFLTCVYKGVSKNPKNFRTYFMVAAKGDSAHVGRFVRWLGPSIWKTNQFYLGSFALNLIARKEGAASGGTSAQKQKGENS